LHNHHDEVKVQWRVEKNRRRRRMRRRRRR
jgi:hypothetical protein